MGDSSTELSWLEGFEKITQSQNHQFNEMSINNNNNNILKICND